MTRNEIAKEINARRARLDMIADEISDHQAMVQRLMVERSVLEGEIHGFEEAARLARMRLPRPANDD